MSEPAGVAIEHVSFGYGATRVLDGVSLEIRKGEFFAFLGPSGSGKTTLLRLVAGFGTPDSGRILIGGRDATRQPPWARNVGLVFQNYALWPHMTVAENVAFGLQRRRVPRAERDRRVRAALDLVGLAHLMDRRPAQLSGGQQQRVAIARTLAIEPEVLLLDEPLSNLDAGLRAGVRAELVELQRRLGLTTILVTHDQEEANAAADRMAVLNDGKVLQVGRPAELYDRPASRFVAGFLGTANLIEGRVDGGAFQAGGARLPLPPGAASGPAVLALRPQALRLLREGDATLPARVLRAEFLGGHVRYILEAGEALTLVAEEPHLRGLDPLPPGAPVGVAIDASQATLLRA
ncbi:polyamine ABC transporter ATP-binding protein [Pseudoroseomonas rhizosphaerae]|uniref:Polyamine ABC transporter ATP-binding protein n=1 Tax=Teichococcus rhizosphaerae TaxID=1335062 RepID=A0A2C7A797_9PROT|nr:ABC transporter ATP-binding protein [Pseudoroseomonas rhizosphaerae]PHK93503.1 polyamine ABC transporter ATP-binding protein [Pseudoroseomonas rhizosphaerae]